MPLNTPILLYTGFYANMPSENIVLGNVWTWSALAMNIIFCCQTENEKSTFHFLLQITKKYIVFYYIWIILYIFQHVFQMAYKQICLFIPALVFDINIGAEGGV